MKSYQAQTWFITGGTGLVGFSVIETLRSNDLMVIALVRETSPQYAIKRLLDLDVKLVYGDLLEASTYEGYLPACDVVVHAAAAVQIKDEKTNWEINFEGTKLICDTMDKMGLKRLVHISTAGVYGISAQEGVTENYPVDPYGPYLKSKYAAEELILNNYENLSATIIRPPFIFGDLEFDRHTLPSLIGGLPKRILPRLWRKNPLLGFVHSEDIGRMVHLVGSRFETPSKIYNIQSFEISLNEILDFVNRSRNGNAIFVPVPYSLLYLFALMGDIIASIRKKPFGLRKRLNITDQNWIFSTELALKELEFGPAHVDKLELERIMSDYYLQSNGKDDEINIKELVDMPELNSNKYE